jgi:hypothetical protein
MSTALVNFASRVLSVDQESNSFVPIVGLNKAADMPILEAIMFAWRGCAILRASLDEDDMEVLWALSPHIAHRRGSAARVTHVAGHCDWSTSALHEPFWRRPARVE